MIIDGINFKELNITKDGELIASITDGKDGIVHKDGYRVQLVVEDVGMSFAEAFKRMKAGRKVKLPSWGWVLVLGYRKRNYYDAVQRQGQRRKRRLIRY